MTSCELCGRKEAEVRANVEGSALSLCSRCARYGTVVGRILPEGKPAKPSRAAPAPQAKQETLELVVPDYARILKQKRERLGLKQEEFARLLNERASLIANMERGEIAPGIELARKMERMLKLKLVEEYREGNPPPRTQGGAVTIGDLVKKK